MGHAVTPPIALQLFTVRDRTEADLPGALKEVAAIGYEGVEFAGLFDHAPHEIRAVLDNVGLRVCGLHISLPRLIADLQSCIHEAQTLGVDLVVVPYLTEEYRTEVGYRHAVREMVAIAERLCDSGLRLAYHHHSFEFQTLGPDSALRGIDILVDSPPDLVRLEIDVYWCRHGGVDPLKFLARHVRRTPLLHLKDMRDARSRKFTEIGSGIIPFRPILKTAAAGGVEWFIVEQDSDFCGTSLESCRRSLEALRTLCSEALP